MTNGNKCDKRSAFDAGKHHPPVSKAYNSAGVVKSNYLKYKKMKMKKITLVWVLCLMACMGATTAQAQTVQCSGFETEDFAEVWSNDYGDLISVVSDDHYSGTKACKIITDPGEEIGTAQTVEITAGKSYALSAYCKLLKDGGQTLGHINATAQLGYVFKDADGGSMTEMAYFPITTTGTWTKGSISTEVAPKGAVGLRIKLNVIGGSTTSVLFDDVAVAEAGAKQSQTITGLSDMTKKVGDAAFDLSATASTPVTYVSNNTSVATISGSTVTIVGAGTTTITASAAASDTYNAAPDVTATLTVNSATVNAQNLLSNPGFELGLDDEGKIKDWLINTDDVTKATFTVETTDKHNGISSAKIAHIGGVYANLYQVVPVTAGLTYTFSFWHNVIAQTTSGSGRIVFFANFYDSNSTQLPMDISSYEVTYTLNTWQQYSVDIVAPANAAYVDFRIRLLSKPTALIDDASLTVAGATKTDQTITGLADITKKVDDAAFNLSATASTEVTYTSSNTSVATISGSTVTIVGAGTTTIIASAAGNDTYNAAPDVTVTLTVSSISGLNEVRTQLPIHIQNHNLIVTAEAGSSIEVYNALGIKQQSKIATNTETEISGLPQGQVLIVRSGKAVAKVIL